MAEITRYDPFRELDDMMRGLVFRPVRMAEPRIEQIKVDATEDDKAYRISAEIPGVRKEDIQVTIEGNQVAIGAEVKRETQPKDGERVLRSERHFGSVQRSYVLPVEIDQASSSARYENGVLELTLAKKAANVGKKLQIQ